MLVESNGIPDHAYGPFPSPRNPNYVVAQWYRFTIPLEPRIAQATTRTPFGPTGIATSGAAFFNPFNALGQDAVVYEAFDQCNGHPSPPGQYHYHQHPVCVGFDAPGTHSAVIGYMFDGYAVHGLQGEGGSPPADLDECNGHTGPDGTYHYHTTKGYPYVPLCYRGVVNFAEVFGR
jgi:hypothetical protein